MNVTTTLVTDPGQLSADDRVSWNSLANNPLQRWEWLGSWYEAYRSSYQLCILRVQRNGKTIGFAPWCLQSRLTTGRTLQFLGSGKACTDHLSLLAGNDVIPEVCHSIADWLVGDDKGGETWDAIEWIGVDQDDQTLNTLAESLRERGMIVDQTEGMGAYAIDLPSRWDDYIQMRSKSGRREMRHALTQIDEGKIRVKRIDDHEQLNRYWPTFVDLHQRRRRASGTTGCFDHPHFGDFLKSAAEALLEAGLLEFNLAISDDKPVAAQFAIADNDAWYFYQSGMDPDASDLRPGLSLFCHAIRSSIESGRQVFDMMRGDEPYKQRWKAKLVPSQEIRVCSLRRAAQLRDKVYKTGATFKHLIKTGLGIGQSTP